jgi:hypothetical protein
VLVPTLSAIIRKTLGNAIKQVPAVLGDRETNCSAAEARDGVPGIAWVNANARRVGASSDRGLSAVVVKGADTCRLVRRSYRFNLGLHLVRCEVRFCQLRTCRHIGCDLGIGKRSSLNIASWKASSVPSNVGCDRDVHRTLRTSSTGKQGNVGPIWLPRLNQLKLRLKPSWLDNQIWTASLAGAPPRSGAETQPCGI